MLYPLSYERMSIPRTVTPGDNLKTIPAIAGSPRRGVRSVGVSLSYSTAARRALKEFSGNGTVIPGENASWKPARKHKRGCLLGFCAEWARRPRPTLTGSGNRAGGRDREPGDAEISPCSHGTPGALLDE